MLRAARGVSQTDLANATGISSSAVSHIERGGPAPRAYNVEKIAKALDVPVDALHFDRVCALELLRMLDISPAELVPGLGQEGPLVESARELAARLPSEQQQHLAVTLRGLGGMFLTPVQVHPRPSREKPASDEGKGNAGSS